MQPICGLQQIHKMEHGTKTFQETLVMQEFTYILKTFWKTAKVLLCGLWTNRGQVTLTTHRSSKHSCNKTVYMVLSVLMKTISTFEY